MKKLLRSKRLVFLFSLFTAISLFIYGWFFLQDIYVPVILMYHSIGEGNEMLEGYYGTKLNVSSESFAKQMEFLHEHGYRVIHLAEFVKRFKEDKRIPRKVVAITFDDGLKNNFLNAFPVLKKYDFPATIFVIANFVGKKDFVTWDDIKTMQHDKITIGSHTLSHKWLPALDEKTVRKELIDSKRVLEKNTGEVVEFLCYPLGGFNEKVKKIAREAGYSGAVTTSPGKGIPNNDPYAIKRVRVSGSADNPINFWVKLSGYYTYIKETRDTD